MDILGIGPLELIFIILIALIVLGPKDMVKSGRVLGKYMRQIVTSPTWRLIQDTSREIRNVPNRLMREAGMEDLQSDLSEMARQAKLPELENKIGGDMGLESWLTPPAQAAPDSEPSGQDITDPISPVDSPDSPPRADESDAPEDSQPETSVDAASSSEDSDGSAAEAQG